MEVTQRRKRWRKFKVFWNSMSCTRKRTKWKKENSKNKLTWEKYTRNINEKKRKNGKWKERLKEMKDTRKGNGVIGREHEWRQKEGRKKNEQKRAIYIFLSIIYWKKNKDKREDVIKEGRNKMSEGKSSKKRKNLEMTGIIKIDKNRANKEKWWSIERNEMK